jgi:hypothetical protein
MAWLTHAWNYMGRSELAPVRASGGWSGEARGEKSTRRCSSYSRVRWWRRRPRSEAGRAVWTPLFRQWRWQAGPTWFNNFPDFSKPVQTCKIKMGALQCYKNSQILHETRLEHYEHLYRLCLLQIPNRKHGKNPGTDSIFESSMDFKGVQTFWKKSEKFFKILSWLDIHKSEFSWAHLYVRIQVTKQEPKRLGLNKKEFEFEIQTLQYL